MWTSSVMLGLLYATFVITNPAYECPTRVMVWTKAATINSQKLFIPSVVIQ
jgi:hypothetical protein